MRPRRRTLAVILVALAGVSSNETAAASKERRFFSAREGVGIEAPPGWTLSLHTGYPNVLAVLVDPGGSRISLAVDRTRAADARALIEESRSGLTAQGVTIDRVQGGPHAGALLEARALRRKQAIRQLYIVRTVDGPRDPRQALVVTLTAPADQIGLASGSFDWVLGRLTLEAPARPDRAPDGGT